MAKKKQTTNVDTPMTLYVIVLVNRKTGRKTLMSFAGETPVFESYQEATFHAHEAYGVDNPSVECRAVRIAGAAENEQG